jgi:peptidoglycan/LPS O-acetylase OafA/YrhL
MPSSRSPILDWLRHGLAVAVILAHCVPLLRGTNATEPLKILSGGQLTVGSLAVFMFFALSGYLITASWRRDPRLLAFARRRLARILPAWGAAMVFGACVVLPLATGQWPRNLQTFIGVDNVAAVFPQNPYPGVLNASLWTIPYELLCYCLVAIVGLLGLHTTRGVVAMLTVGGVINVFLRVRFGLESTNMLLILTFWMGGLAYFTPNIRPPRWAHALIIGSLPFAVMTHMFVVFLPLYAYWLLTWLPHCSAPALPVDWSYGLYVYTFPIQQGIVAVLGPQLHPLVLGILSLAVSLPICALSWRWLEAPILRRAAGRMPHSAPQAIFERHERLPEGVTK